MIQDTQLLVYIWVPLKDVQIRPPGRRHACGLLCPPWAPPWQALPWAPSSPRVEDSEYFQGCLSNLGQVFKISLLKDVEWQDPSTARSIMLMLERLLQQIIDATTTNILCSMVSVAWILLTPIQQPNRRAMLLSSTRKTWVRPCLPCVKQ